MGEIRVPVLPLDKADQVAKQIVKSSAKAEESDMLVFHQCVLLTNDSLEELELILFGMGMEKHTDLFLKSHVDLHTFLLLDESDLRELGITDNRDLEIILKNLDIYEGKRTKLSLPYSPHDDVQIAKNIRHELLILQNYCSYLELQMRKHKFTDYRINSKESASTYLKAFTEAALLQANILSEKSSKLILSETQKEMVKKKKSKQRLKTFVAVVFGILSVAVLVKTFNMKE